MSFQEPHKIIIFCAPSGAGKTTIAHKMMERFSQLSFSVSATSRQPRATEKNGVDYYFVSAEEFKARVANGDFVEWEEVYPDRFYGTLKSELTRLAGLGKTPVFDIDVKGAMNLKKLYGDLALVVFVKAPLEMIEARLRARQTETPETLAVRMNRVKEEMEYEGRADVVINNIDLDTAVNECQNVVKDFLTV